jgi:transcriptional regulator with XRE-family HTH domain
MQEPDPLSIFGTKLREIRTEKHVSQEELAFIAGLDRTYVSGVERGVRNISLKNIYKLAIALNVEPALFFMTEKTDQHYE